MHQRQRPRTSLPEPRESVFAQGVARSMPEHGKLIENINYCNYLNKISSAGIFAELAQPCHRSGARPGT